MTLLEPILLDRSKNGNEYIFDLQDERFKFSVKRSFPEVIIHIANQVNQTFLLLAFETVIAAVKIRNQDTLIVSEQFMHNRCLSCFRQPEDDMGSIRKHPHILFRSPNVDM